MTPEQSAVRWYAACKAFLTLPEPLRCGVSRQTLAHYRKIRDIPPDLGEDLDRRGAPFAVLRWIAWGATTAETRARHAAAVKLYASTGRWSSPRERRRTRRAKPRAA